jgi:hypothetical protein
MFQRLAAPLERHRGQSVRVAPSAPVSRRQTPLLCVILKLNDAEIQRREVGEETSRRVNGRMRTMTRTLSLTPGAMAPGERQDLGDAGVFKSV